MYVCFAKVSITVEVSLTKFSKILDTRRRSPKGPTLRRPTPLLIKSIPIHIKFDKHIYKLYIKNTPPGITSLFIINYIHSLMYTDFDTTTPRS